MRLWPPILRYAKAFAENLPSADISAGEKEIIPSSGCPDKSPE
jgi:hypothetical protein